MNNIIKNTGLALAFTATLISCDNDKKMSSEEFPEEIKSYVQTNFPNQTIVSMEVDNDGLEKEYEVVLSGDIKLDFNKDKNLTDIETPNGVPDSIIPVKIKEYVRTNHPNTTITDWEMDDREQSVELSDGKELDFDIDGNYLNFDH